MNSNHTSLKLLTPPAFEPVSVALAKAHMRISDTLSDALIGTYISAARAFCEDMTGRNFVTQTWRMSLDRFPLLPNTQYAPGNPNIVQPAVNNLWPLDPSAWAIFLPRCPLLAVTSITYESAPGQTTTVDPSVYRVDSDSEPPRITTQYGAFWPSAMFDSQAIQIVFTTGYAAPTVAVTGTTSPATADTYTQIGTYQNQPSYQNSTGTEFLWNDGTNWNLSAAIGTNGSASFQGASLPGGLLPLGTATGTATATPQASTIPVQIIQAILLIVSHWFEHREAVYAGMGATPGEVPMAAGALLRQISVPWCWA